MTTYTKIISRINELRGAMSVNAFAKFIGIQQKALDMYLKEERKPSVELIKSVCSKCGVSADWLLCLDDAKHKMTPPSTCSVCPLVKAAEQTISARNKVLATN